MAKADIIQSAVTGQRYATADGELGMPQPPMGKGGKSYYLDGEDPRKDVDKDPKKDRKGF